MSTEARPRARGVFSTEMALLAGLLTTVLFTLFGGSWLTDLSSPL